MKNCLILYFILFVRDWTLGYRIFWDNSVDVDFNNLDIDGVTGRMGDDIHLPNWFFIFPGTKWCGAGNIAENDDDYGTERDTDKCCQAHDKCPDIIEGHQTKYNLTNPNFFTRLNCDCDQQFYQCLKSVGRMTSIEVGQIYFTALGTQCFKNDYPISGCNKYTYFPKQKCLSYIYDDTQEKKYQWFDLPNF